jgi:hypothetical protein
MAKKFQGSFLALMKTGSDYCNQQRFWPLHAEGKPLWEFKEHDHRLYCVRQVITDTRCVNIVLLYGWVKDKAGRTKRENREIEKGMSFYREFVAERTGGVL